MNSLYEIKNLNIYFQSNGFNILKNKNINKAVDNVNLDIFKGETLGLVGESGSGKSTLGKALIKLIKPTNGSILYKGKEIANLEKNNLREMRKNFQIIFQDPFSSLNPRKTVTQIVPVTLFLW